MKMIKLMFMFWCYGDGNLAVAYASGLLGLRISAATQPIGSLL